MDPQSPLHPLATLPPELAALLQQLLFPGGQAGVPVPPPAPTLSPREQEIVRLVAVGLPNKAIAAVLEISVWTVATHLRRVFAKLEVNSRAGMVARAWATGLLREVALPPVYPPQGEAGQQR